MTALQRLVSDAIAAFQERQWYESAAWETRARKTIKAMAESRHRSIGQRFRYIAARLAANRGGKR